MRIMRDERGSAFVRSLSEGTKTMLTEMQGMNLPAPHYKTDERTALTLYNNLEEREAEHARASMAQTVSESETGEFTNLFPLKALNEDGTISEIKSRELFKNRFLIALRDALAGKNWIIDNFSFSRLIAHRKGNSLPQPKETVDIFRIYPAYVFQIRQYGKESYLCIDYKVELKSIKTVGNLLSSEKGLQIFEKEKLVGKVAVVRREKQWERGRILGTDYESTKISLFDVDTTIDAPNSEVIPSLSKTGVVDILRKLDRMSLPEA